MIQVNFTVTPSSGDVYGTEFTFNSQLTGSYKKLVWNLGNNELSYNVETFSYIYNYPGIYNVTLSATDFDNNHFSITKQITATYPFPTSISFTQIPDEFSDPGLPTKIPFKINVVSTQIDTATPLMVDLFASNSKSTPYQFIPEKWNFLTPTWRFLDKNFNFITTLSVTPVPIYKNNRVVAVSGSDEFYYIDTLSTGLPNKNCPILITATLQTSGISNYNDSNVYQYPSHANNKTVSCGVLWQINDFACNILKVTGNYLTDINPKQWAGVKIPVLITCHGNRAGLILDNLDPISQVLFSYPDIPTSTYPLTISLSGLQPSDYIVDEAPLYFQATNQEGYRTGGYIFTTITPLVTTDSTCFVVQTTTTKQIESIGYPYGYAPFPAVWVSNPQRNTLNKITLLPYPNNCKTINYYKNNRLLYDGVIKEVSVPYITTPTTFNYSMSGFSGIYSIAIDPRKNELIACDSELDRLYRFSNTGQILKTFDLSSLKDFDPNKKIFTNWTWKADDPSKKKLKYGVYGPTPLSPNPLNYIITIGNFIHPISSTNVDIIDRTIWAIPEGGAYSNNYPPSGTEVNAIQIFNPLLSAEISSLYYWTTTTPFSTSSLLLSSNPLLTFTSSPLLSNTNHYLVSINGVLQQPSTYTINTTLSTINFISPIQSNTTVNIHYLPSVIQPASWTQTFTSSTTSFSLFGLSGFNATDPYTGFLVNFDGVLCPQYNYNYNFTTKALNFKINLPLNIPITVTQYSVSNNSYTPAAYTPTYVSLDKDFNIWVSLFNTVSVLKFDKDFNFLFSVVPNNLNWKERAWTVNPDGIDYQAAQFGSLSGYTDPVPLDLYHNEFFAKPPVAETDKENNCWVTYANPLCSFVVKYSSTGQTLSTITLPQYTMPVSVAVDANNDVWIANFHGSSYFNTPFLGSIQKYNSNTSTLLKTITGISRPGLLAFDNNNNLWFTHGIDRLGFYNTQTEILCSWTLTKDGFNSFIFPVSGLFSFDFEENRDNENFGGLGVDVFNRVWVIDSFHNFAWSLSATPQFLQQPIRKFKIRPDTLLGYYVNEIGQTFTKEFDDYNSAQAIGDWTGNKWYQKYEIYNINNLSSIPVSAISTNFTIEPFTNKNDFKIINESFNTSEYLKSLALPEILKNNTTLFDKFFTAAVGTGTQAEFEDLGEKVYEKIANFIQNHGDLETCGIDQLLSIAQSIGVSTFDYGASYPSEIKRMIDIGSINRKKLWGIKDNIPILNKSIGKEYNTFTDYVTAGTKVVLRSKIDRVVSLINVPPLSTQTVYPLSSITLYGFAEPVLSNYIFYRFNPVYTNTYIENIIDWESPETTLQETLSTNEDWYGEAGSLETIFRYLLTKNLFLK